MTDATAYQSAAAAERERRVVDFIPLVHHVLARLAVALPPHVDREDLLGAGVVGLVQAARSFDPTRGASFKSHAFTRVRGAILDELRRADPLPKQKRERVRALEAAQARLLAEHGTAPSLEELGRSIGASEEEVDALIGLSKLAAPLSQDAPLDDAGCNDPAAPDEEPSALAARAERVTALVEALTLLPQREREVVGLYYFDGLLLRQIGQLLGVTESRACQLHARAMYLLRSELARRKILS